MQLASCAAIGYALPRAEVLLLICGAAARCQCSVEAAELEKELVELPLNLCQRCYSCRGTAAAVMGTGWDGRSTHEDVPTHEVRAGAAPGGNSGFPTRPEDVHRGLRNAAECAPTVPPAGAHLQRRP